MPDDSPEPERIDVWKSDNEDLRLEVGFAGECNVCETSLETDGSAEGRLKCPDCGLVVGFVGRYPTLSGEGELGSEPEWPKKKTGWDIEDERAMVSMFIRGQHIDCGELVENVAESDFGPDQDAACSGCKQKFGYAMSVNVIEDPLEAEA